MHQLRAPFIVITGASAIVAIRKHHRVERFSDFPVFPAKKDLAKTMAVGSKKATHPDRHRQHHGLGEPTGQCTVIGATVETPHPSLGSPENCPFVRPDNHFTGRIEGPDSRENLLGNR
ncbi:hypothetical protein N9044_00190 [bacterium]|jgi:hypothetical protein|nr:hypothetical protein [bacterium]MDB4484187.1 hypothetical protein [bacterium]MDB4809466.1 hypothetical protein [bacterium]